jgi:hypothetical protein
LIWMPPSYSRCCGNGSVGGIRLAGRIPFPARGSARDVLCRQRPVDVRAAVPIVGASQLVSGQFSLVRGTPIFNPCADV